MTHPPGDTHVYYNSRQTVAPPDAEHVYYNEQSGVRETKKQPQNNLQTLPDVPHELYSKLNTHSQAENDSDHYDHLQPAGGSGEVGVSGGVGEGETNVENQDLEYVDIDHSLTLNQRSGVIPRSSGVTYTEVQHKRDSDTDQQVNGGDTW